jgi:hypothetical protein
MNPVFNAVPKACAAIRNDGHACVHQRMLRGFGIDQYFRICRMPAKESARIIELRGRKPAPAGSKG